MKKRIRIFAFFIAVILTFSQVISGTFIYAAEKVNIDLALKRTVNSVKSGQSAVFELDLKVSGANEEVNKEIGKDSKLTIKFPIEKTQYYNMETPLEELAINGVVPAYDKTQGSLTYVFPEMLTGFSARKYISISTTNGVTPDGTELAVNAKYEYNNSTLSVEDKDSINVTANVSPTVHKELVKIVDDETANAARPGYDVIYRLDASVAVPNSDHQGSLYLEPNSDILVKDTLDSRLSYVASGTSVDNLTEAGEGLNLTKNGQNLTWGFKSDTLERQKTQKVNIFESHIFVKVHVSDDIKEDTRIDNTATMTATGLGGVKISTSTSNKVTVPVLLPKGATLDGNNIAVRATYGPGADSTGQNPNKGRTAENGVDFLDVYTGAASSHEYIVKDGTSEEYKWNNARIMAEGYKELVAYYTPSDNINLRSIHILLPFAFKNGGGFKELTKVPTVTATFTLEDGSTKQHVFDYSAVSKTFAPGQPGGLDLAYEALGLKKDDKVKSIKINYKNADGSLVDGEFAIQAALRYDIMPGTAVGSKLEQKVEFVATLKDGTVVRRGPKQAPNQYEGLVAERYDTLIAPQEVPPTVEQVATFMNVIGSEVKSGDNRVYVALSNYQSASELTEYPHSIVVLPLGVKIKENHTDTDKYYIRSQRAYTYTVNIPPGEISIFSDDYMGTGHQAIMVKWNQETLKTKERLVAEFDVTIDKYAPDDLSLQSFGFAKTLTDKMLKRKDTSPIITETTDLNGDGITGRDIATSNTLYVKNTDHDLKIEKFVKGSRDTEFSKFGYTTPGGSIDYKLKITNNTGENIYKLGFLDILPTVGDLEVIKNSPRNSAFTPLLTGPIVLPAEWIDKVVVYYSTETNPTRTDILYEKVKYPTNAYKHEEALGAVAPTWLKESDVTDWKTIRSFKIELNNGDIWAKGQDIEITFKMVAPESTDADYVIMEKVTGNLADKYPRLAYAKNAAWNSFAMTTNGILPTEPERVGVIVLDLRGSVRAEYYIVNTDTKLQDDKQVKDVGTPVDELYSDVPPEEITSKNGKIYRLVKTEENTPLLKNGSDSPSGVVTNVEKVIKYQYELVSGGQVSVKYIIEGTEITLENPVLKEKDENGNYVVKKENTEIGTEYDTTTPDFMPKTLVKDGKTYVLTERKTDPKTDPVTGKVIEEPQLIIYEYKLQSEPVIPEDPNPNIPDNPNPNIPDNPNPNIPDNPNPNIPDNPSPNIPDNPNPNIPDNPNPNIPNNPNPNISNKNNSVRLPKTSVANSIGTILVSMGATLGMGYAYSKKRR
ncbi:MAG: isopeptide-forming domain-containing fimbrial protein [Parvimonas sp.]|uniref:isopeptide-forming domain-containing fimbrial protein n=1 Tax=Parvimonas sp. TaxID=1944660 RepID=UPI002A764760|nr:isopeptide-forming domain-containing fimbrial protein [Parvimonas sp.]MDY3051238.1 isopeptide-forming domain-containing fimbrial protein [Parvimonas sp.]